MVDVDHHSQLLHPLEKVIPLVVKSIRKNPLASPKMQILYPEILNPLMNKFPSIQRPSPSHKVFLGSGQILWDAVKSAFMRRIKLLNLCLPVGTTHR